MTLPFNHIEWGAEASRPSAQLFPLFRHCAVAFQEPFDLYGRVTRYAPHSFFIEQDGRAGGVSRRFSYVGGDPYLVLKAKGRRVQTCVSGIWKEESGDPLTFLESLLLEQQTVALPHLPPFQGGGVGCFSYDVVRQFEVLPEATIDDLNFPDIYFLFVEIYVVLDSHMPGAWLVFAPSPKRVASENWEDLYQEGQRRLADLEARVITEYPGLEEGSLGLGALDIVGEQSSSDYINRVRECQEFIGAGDIYQANVSHRFYIEGLGQRFSSQIEAGVNLYRQIRQVNPSPHSALLVLESEVIVCNSPERLVRLSEGRADMRPIAGTRPRGTQTQDDRRLAEDLLSSQKERAEHVMLVDLARNDLGSVCQYGSVRVHDLMIIERYSHVMHLVSQLSGLLRDHLTGFDLIRATFPGGTITGVPKIHCMELIEQLEPVRRGLYTGSIGFIGWNGNVDLNIVIRTLLLTENRGYLQVGAGIVADSDPSREFEETLHKADAFFHVLQPNR